MTPTNIWLKDDFERMVVEMVDQERATRVRFSIPPMTDDEALELETLIMRGITGEVPPAGNG